MSVRKWFNLGPSRYELIEQAQQRERELLHELLGSEREARRELAAATAQQQAELLRAMASSSNVFSDYLKLVTSAGAPRVRVMDDGAEAAQEASRRKDAGYPGMKSLREIGDELITKQDPSKVAQDFENIKLELGL